MFKDRTAVWVVEYVLGGILAVGPLAAMGLWGSDLAAEPAFFHPLLSAGVLFVSLGVILIACASSMRQRLLLADRIDRLAERLAEQAGQAQRPQA